MRLLIALLIVCSTTALIAQPKETKKKPEAAKTAKVDASKKDGKAVVPAKPGINPSVKPSVQPSAGASLVPSNQKSYADSAAFQKAFAELFPLIRPQATIKDRTMQNFAMNSRRLDLTSQDSLRLLDSVLKTIDASRDEQILFASYRAVFTAEEIKGLAAFLKTPAGKHFLEVEPRLMQARTSEIERYISGVVSKALMPYRIAQQNARAQARAAAKANAPGGVSPTSAPGVHATPSANGMHTPATDSVRQMKGQQ